MKIALIQLPHFYGTNQSRPQESYPLGLGYISNFLAANNLKHEAVDLWGLQYTPEEALEKINFSTFDVFGISAYSTQYNYLKKFSLKLKQYYPEIPIICGGPGPTFNWEIILQKTGVDICVLGEGEITITDLLQNLKKLDTVRGIAYKNEGQILCNEKRELIKDLDTIPFPNRELFDFEKIISNNAVLNKQSCLILEGELLRSADIVAGRGCPYKCNYCSKTFDGLRMRSIENIISEIVYLKEKYCINHIRFNDELVLVNKRRTLQLCEELKKLKLIWSCQGRINQVDRTVLSAMKDAGCVEVGYGVESISQSILDSMNKKLKSEIIVPVVKMTQETGIRPIIQYMYGYPGENDESIAATIKFFKDIDHPYIGFTTTPIPGSQLYHDCKKKGIITDEEDYLLRLDSGYNLDSTTVNLTGFADAELLRKKKILKMMVNHNYLKKRPGEYLRYISRVIFTKLGALLKRAGRRWVKI